MVTHYYNIRRWGSPRFREPCRIIVARSRNGNIEIQFADGERMVTTRYGVRRLRP